MESVTICGVVPGVIVADGAKEAVAPAGNGVSGDMLNVTRLENAPSVDATVNTKFAVWPAETGGSELGGITL